MTQVFDCVIEAAKQTIKKAPTEKAGLPFSVNPMGSFKGISEALTQSPSYKGKVKILTDVIAGLVETYLTDRRGTGSLMFFNFTGDSLSSNQFLFNYSMKPSDLKSWQEKMYQDSLSYFYHQIAKLNSLGICSFSKEDIDFLGESKVDAIDTKKISCFAYALLKAKEVQAKKLILDTKDDPKLNVETFKNWGYRTVTHPDDGDLALYMDDTSEGILHLGIFRNDEKTCQGLIESKWGINNSEIFLHPVFDVPANYGTKVVFMRKNQFTFTD